MNEVVYLYGALGVVLIGFYGLARAGHALQQLLAVNVMGAGVFMLLLALAARHTPADAVPQALVLTGIVVAISTLALGLALIRRLAVEERKAANAVDAEAAHD
jgi:multicomponent Na+:H+ antiporter subunit C